MKKRLTEVQFQNCIKYIEIDQRSAEIAYGVLVVGRPQSAFVMSTGLSRGAIARAVNRVWHAFVQNDVPPGHERVTVVLPEYQAFVVRQWATEAARKLDGGK